MDQRLCDARKMRVHIASKDTRTCRRERRSGPFSLAVPQQNFDAAANSSTVGCYTSNRLRPSRPFPLQLNRLRRPIKQPIASGSQCATTLNPGRNSASAIRSPQIAQPRRRTSLVSCAVDVDVPPISQAALRCRDGKPGIFESLIPANAGFHAPSSCVSRSMLTVRNMPQVRQQDCTTGQTDATRVAWA